MNRVQKKNDLLMKLGMLFKPLNDLVGGSPGVDAETQTRILARYATEALEFVVDMREFAESEPGHRYEIEAQKLALATQGLVSALATTEKVDLNTLVPLSLKRAREAIEAIPVTQDPIIIAGPLTPYKGYCELRDIVASATSELVLIDPYLDHSVFHRFLTAAFSEPLIILVTQEARMGDPRERRRWEEFLDVSRLYAAEKGATRYELSVLKSGLHDRWMLADRVRLYQLGGSVKDAGVKHFTVTVSKADPNIVNTILTLALSGTQYFGARTPIHV